MNPERSAESVSHKLTDDVAEPLHERVVKFAGDLAFQLCWTEDVAEACCRCGQREVGPRDIKGEGSGAGCSRWPRKAAATVDANVFANEDDVAKDDVRRIAVDGRFPSDGLPHKLGVDDLGVFEVARFQCLQRDGAQNET